jgi:hypothetical protein
MSLLVGLITDTHDNKVSVLAAVDLFNRRGVKQVLHGGDYVAPFNAGWMRNLRAPLVGVFGNNDGERFGLRSQFERLGPIHRAPHVAEVGDRRILMLHEPDELEALASANAYDVIFYGHTHEIDVRPGPPLIVNPGEAGGWVTGRSTVGLLDLKTLDVEIVDLGEGDAQS